MFNHKAVYCAGLIGLLAASLHAEGFERDWAYSQTLQVPQKGVVRVQLPLETLSNAQPNRGDFRLVDPVGLETSYWVDQPLMQGAQEMSLEKMTMTLGKGKTVITGSVPPVMLTQGFDMIYIYTATDDFLKPLTVEGSRDQIHWVPLVSQYPFFKQPGEPVSSRVELPKGQWPFLRITLDDSASAPIRVQSVRLYAGAKKLPNLQTVTPVILESTSDGHQTEIQLLLPADNLTLDALHLDIPYGVYKRGVSVFGKTYAAGEFRETPLGRGSVYQVVLNQKAARYNTVAVGRQVPGRQLILRIENGDSRPLTITRVTADVIPAYLVFDAQRTGPYTLWSGNLLADFKNYDVSALRESAQGAVRITQVGPLAKNSAYHAPEPLPQITEQGSEIDVSSWRYRKKLTLQQPGVQRIEPDLQVLAHNAGRLAALRVVQEGKQIPYVVDHLEVGRNLDVALEEAPAKGSASQWVLTLPEKNLPVNMLLFTVKETLFQRNLTVWENIPDERGDTQRQVVGQASWVRTSEKSPDTFAMVLYHPLRSNKLFLETDNRDNLPIHVTGVKGFYQTPRLIFKANPGKDLYLYYGNDDVAAPQYDLNLVAGQLLAVPPAEAILGSEDVLKAQPWWEIPTPETGTMKYLFWALMGIVVIVLLIVIAKLLPEEQSRPDKTT